MSFGSVIHFIMCPLDRWLLVRPALDIYGTHRSGPRREDGRKHSDEKPLSLLDLFALFLTRYKLLTTSMTALLISCQTFSKWLQAISQKSQIEGQRFTTMTDVQKKHVKLWPRVTSLSLKVPGHLKRQEDHFPLGLKTPLLALWKRDNFNLH